MTEIPLRAEWMIAFRKEKGYKLMTFVRREPRLVTVKYRGCNVLHLAMRKRWYGLVQEVLQKFNHLYRDASSLVAADTGQDTGAVQSSPAADSLVTTGGGGSALDLADFRDLLEAKEGHRGGEPASYANYKDARWKYASGLDVFAMAVIEGHAAINTSLAEAISKVDGLFDHGHPYKDVIRFMGPEGPSTDAFGEEREMLNEIMKTCFADVSSKNQTDVNIGLRTASEPPHAGSSVSTTEQKGASTVAPTTPAAASSGPNLEHRLEDARQEWELTSPPVLPFQEFLFLACCSRPRAPPYDSFRDRVLEGCADSAKGISFKKYLLAINDTWGTAVHHTVRARSPDKCISIDDVLGMMPADDDLSNYINVHDSAGRTPLYAALALDDRSGKSNLLGHEGTNVHNLRNSTASGRWQFNDHVGQTDVAVETLLRRRGTNVDSLRNSTASRRLQFNDPVGQTDVAVKKLLRQKGTVVHNLRNSKASGRWQFKDHVWQTDVAVVSAVNGYSADEISDSSTTAFHVIIRSPHLTDSDRERRTGMTLKSTTTTELMPLQAPSRCPTLGSLAMTPLQFAAHVGDTATLNALAKDDRVYDPARVWNESRRPDNFSKEGYSALHLAAIAGHFSGINTILTTGKFDPLVEDRNGNTALHLATYFEVPPQFPHSLADFCEIPDERIGTPYEAKSSLSAKARRELERIEEYKRQGCISLLLRAGIDVWKTNRGKEIADPGPKASPEYCRWWYEQLSVISQEDRTSLIEAANATSVTAALVYAGSPLQPPNTVDVPGRIFVVCNTLGFYLALAAIILCLIPMLPLSQESVLDELKLIRRIVTLGVSLLILSVLTILGAFASASIATWNNEGLTTSILGLGGLISLLVLTFCVVRLLRIALHKKKFARRLYRKYMCM